jgi:hypothetical protein
MSGDVVGLRPWLPWPLSRWHWWTEPVPAERLAALRIGLAAALLLDLLTTYLPGELPAEADGAMVRAALLLWLVAAVALLLGACSRVSAALAWGLGLSFAAANPGSENAGDVVRNIVLLYLVLTPCGAVWSVDARGRRGRVGVYPWALRLLFVQMVLIYFLNGLHKALGRDWQRGDALYYVLGDWTLARWSYAQVPVPYALTRLLSWLVLGWECLLPLLVLWRPLRVAALGFGAVLHVGIWLSLELGGFAPYMLCLYLPLLPWERWGEGERRGLSPPSSGSGQLGQGGPLDGQEVGAGHGHGDGVVAGVEVDRGVQAQGGVAGGGQPEQGAERRDRPGL